MVLDTSSKTWLMYFEPNFTMPLQGFLHIDEYPPDANQGFDIPSAIVSFPDFQTRIDFLGGNSSKKSPMISKLHVTIMSCL